ncbi:MAG: DUF3038 domain-containing protein [Cyanobacteria bacterium REEB444]|nr:DUF3038 domain-containing protein [Cyanobacteria bacterium REEB444]
MTPSINHPTEFRFPDVLAHPVLNHTQQLDDIAAQLDLIVISFETLTGTNQNEYLSAVEALNLTGMVSTPIGSLRYQQSSPVSKGQGGRKSLDINEVRSLVLIVCHLAREHQEFIRRAVGLLEQVRIQNQSPHRTALLGNYIDAFSNAYQVSMNDGNIIPPQQITFLALKLLIDLLFYSGAGGVRRLWFTLLERAMIHGYAITEEY